MEDWLIPTIGIVIALVFGVFKIAVPLTSLTRSVATKADIENLKSEMKSEHASLSGKVDKLSDKVDRHIEYHAGYQFKPESK